MRDQFFDRSRADNIIFDPNKKQDNGTGYEVFKIVNLSSGKNKVNVKMVAAKIMIPPIDGMMFLCNFRSSPGTSNNFLM